MQLGATTCGVWTREQALAVVSPAVLRRLLRDRWQTVLPGVYCDREVTLDARQRAWAAVLASGRDARAVAMGRTAARVWGLPLIDDDDPATGALEHVLDEVAVRGKNVPQRVGASRALTRHQPVFGPGDVVRGPAGSC